MKISSIQKKGKSNIEITFEDDKKLLLNYEIFLKFALNLNSELTHDEAEKIILENKKYLLKQSALRYLARRPHSKNELKVKLLQKKFDNNLIHEILTELESKNYLNDLDFAQSFVEEKIKNKKIGRNKLRTELIRKGISAEIIQQVLNQNICDEEEIKLGTEIAQKKFERLLKHNFDEKKIKSRIFNFLISKGYDIETARQIVSQLKFGTNLNGDEGF